MTSTPITPNLSNMFSPNPNGDDILNVEAIATLIRWAEGDEALAERFGTWDQGIWGKILLGHPVGEYRDDLDQDAIDEAQRNGHCQTAYCMAGQAVVQAGYRLLYTIDDDEAGEATASYCVMQEPTGQVNRFGMPIMRDIEDSRTYISDAARSILGLTPNEAMGFFDGSNRVEDLKYLANRLCAHRGLPPMYEGVRQDCYGSQHWLGYEED